MMLDPQTSVGARFAALIGEAQPRLVFAARRGTVPDWQAELRSELRELLVIDEPAARPGAGEVVSERDMGDYLRQYVRFPGRDGITIPAYRLVPKGLRGPGPAVICLHGHGPGKVVPAGFEQDLKGRPVEIVGERDYAVQAVREGYIALAPDLLGFGELMLPDDVAADRGGCDQLGFRALMAGRTLLGMRVAAVSSCVDCLLTDQYVDPARIVCTGQSGGGTATLFATALDTRLALSLPSCYFCTFKASILAMSHCSCNYAPGLLNLCEMPDVAGLIAPRPLLVIAGAEDPIFPLAGVQEAYQQVQGMYDALGAAANLELYVGPEGHRYYKARAWSFVREHL